MVVDRSSVRWRMTLGATLVLLLGFVVTFLVAAGLLRRALTSDTDAILREQADAVEATVTAGALPGMLDAAGPLSPRVQVVDGSGRVIAESAGLPDGVTFALGIGPPPAGEQAIASVDGAVMNVESAHDFRVLARTVDAGAEPVTIYVTESLRDATRAEEYLRNAMLVALPAIVLLAGLLLYRVVRGALAPVDAMRAEVDRIQSTDLSARVDARVGRDEVARLGQTLNGMLDRLEDAAVRQELFASSAAHELRSPVSAIRTELEVGLAYPDRAEWPRIAQECLIDVGRLEALSRDLRVLTRSGNAAATVAERFDLAAVVKSEVTHRRPAKPIDVDAAAGAAPVVADRDGVVRAIRNLLDNAERHARSAIRVSVASELGAVALVVSNDGDRIPPDQLERIFHPFTRLDEARSLDTGGSGLGLAIARAVMEANGGALVAVDVAEGAEFRARLPAAPFAGATAARS